MSEKIEDLSFDYRDENGVLVRREVDRAVLSKGAWATIMFLYQDLNRSAGEYRPPKVAIVRYRKTNGVYRKQSSFNISSERQGRMIMEVLEKWYGMSEADFPPGNLEAAQKAEVQGETAPAETTPPAEAQASTTDSVVPEENAPAIEAPTSTPVQETPMVEESPSPVGSNPSPFGSSNP